MSLEERVRALVEDYQAEADQLDEDLPLHAEGSLAAYRALVEIATLRRVEFDLLTLLVPADGEGEAS